MRRSLIAVALILFFALPARGSIMAEKFFRDGVRKAEQKKWTEAIALFERALRFKKVFPLAQYNLAQCYHRKGDRKRALQAYRNAVTQSPKMVQAYNNMALLLESMGKPEEAIKVYQKAIGIDPSKVALHYNLGNLYYRAKKLVLAEKAYLQAVKHFPKDADALFNLGMVQIKLRKDGEAKKTFTAVLKRQSNNVSALYQLATMAQRKKDHKQAIVLFRKIIAINGKLIKPWIRLAFSLKNSGDSAGEKAALKKACELGFKPACGR